MTLNLGELPVEPLKLQLDVVVGLYDSIAITHAWSSHPNFWDSEVSNVGTIHPDDLGIPAAPRAPGRYTWTGTLKTYGPDMDGDYDAEYQGAWKRLGEGWQKGPLDGRKFALVLGHASWDYEVAQWEPKFKAWVGKDGKTLGGDTLWWHPLPAPPGEDRTPSLNKIVELAGGD